MSVRLKAFLVAVAATGLCLFVYQKVQRHRAAPAQAASAPANLVQSALRVQDPAPPIAAVGADASTGTTEPKPAVQKTADLTPPATDASRAKSAGKSRKKLAKNKDRSSRTKKKRRRRYDYD